MKAKRWFCLMLALVGMQVTLTSDQAQSEKIVPVNNLTCKNNLTGVRKINIRQGTDAYTLSHAIH